MKNIKNNEKLGFGQVFASGVLWGVIGICVTQMSVNGSDAMLTSFLRASFAFLILAAMTLFKYGIKVFRVDIKTLIVCALLGLVCQGVYNILYSNAIVMIGVTLSAVLLDIAPVFTAITAYIIFSEKMTVNKLFAIIINIIGCIFAVTGGKISVESISVIGILCGAGAGICYALAAIFSRLAGEKTNAFVISTYSYLFAALFLAIFLKPHHVLEIINIKIVAWGFFYALVPTAIAYLLYYLGVQKITESSKVPVIASVETVISLLAGVMIYKENIGMINFLGIIMVMFSIYFMNRKSKPVI